MVCGVSVWCLECRLSRACALLQCMLPIVCALLQWVDLV